MLVTVVGLAVATIGLGMVVDAAGRGAAVIVVAGVVLMSAGAVALSAGAIRVSTNLRSNLSTTEERASTRNTLGRAAQVILLLGAALILFSGVGTVVELAGQLAQAVGRNRFGLVVELVGTVLRVTGLVLVVVGQVGRLNSEELSRPFMPPGAIRTWRGRRHLQRQIGGEQPCTTGEVPLLRATAAWMLSLKVSAASTVGLVLFPLGLAITPLPLPEWSSWSARCCSSC